MKISFPCLVLLESSQQAESTIKQWKMVCYNLTKVLFSTAGCEELTASKARGCALGKGSFALWVQLKSSVVIALWKVCGFEKKTQQLRSSKNIFFLCFKEMVCNSFLRLKRFVSFIWDWKDFTFTSPFCPFTGNKMFWSVQFHLSVRSHCPNLSVQVMRRNHAPVKVLQFFSCINLAEQQYFL